MKLTSGDFCELNRTYRQTCRSTFGVGQVVEVDGDLAVVRWLIHSRRDLRDPALQTERLPTCYLRRIKPDRDSRFRAVRHAQTGGRTPRKAPVDLRRADQYAACRNRLAALGLHGYRLNLAATRLTDRCLAFEDGGMQGNDRVNVGELLA